MGLYFVCAFLGVFMLAIGSAVLKRKLNPYAGVSYAELPVELRAELERVMPGFQPRGARITKRGDEARVDGECDGESVSVEADFHPAGTLVDFEIELRVAKRVTGQTDEGALPLAARAEVDRVLGKERAAFELRRVLTGSVGGEPLFEVKGTAGDWKWEIAVTGDGRLLEVEKERRRA